jgi:hypothetical protein
MGENVEGLKTTRLYGIIRMAYHKRRKKNNKQRERFKAKYQKKETEIIDCYGLRKQGGYENRKERHNNNRQ